MSDEQLQAVLDAEIQRCEAISTGNLAALASLLAEDYVHVHGNGRIGGKADYIAGVERAPRSVRSSNMTVRMFEGVAVMIGDIHNKIRFPDRELVLDLSATFVLHRRAGQWTFVSGQLTPKRDDL